MTQTEMLLIAVGVLVLLLVLWLILRPKQRVTLSDDTPVRPHMVDGALSTEGRSIFDEAAAATSDVAGQILKSDVHENLPGAVGEPDDLKQLKGVGPKLATMLNQMGIMRYDQIAKLAPSQVNAIDAQLGAFKGRFHRDRIVEQADYLSRGDTDGYQAKFGKL
jgi:predicted flap endonuclease-1-like 5' DNA nuclease